MTNLIELTLIGFISTSAMISFLWIVTGLSENDVDMVKAVGSIYTQDTKNAFVPGLLMQLTFGIISCFVYALFLNIPDFDRNYKYAGLAIMMSFFHGLGVTIVLKFLLAENHPVEKYQTVTWTIAFHHLYAHLIYGTVLGSLFAVFMN